MVEIMNVKCLMEQQPESYFDAEPLCVANLRDIIIRLNHGESSFTSYHPIWCSVITQIISRIFSIDSLHAPLFLPVVALL